MVDLGPHGRFDLCDLDGNGHDWPMSVGDLDVAANRPGVADGFEFGPGRAEVTESRAQRRVEVFGEFTDCGAKCRVKVSGGSGGPADPQFHCDATLDEKQRLAVVAVPCAVEHCGNDHEPEPTPQSPCSDARVVG